MNTYKVVFTDESEEIFDAKDDNAAMKLAKAFFSDRWDGNNVYWQYYTPESVYRADAFGVFDTKIF